MQERPLFKRPVRGGVCRRTARSFHQEELARLQVIQGGEPRKPLRRHRDRLARSRATGHLCLRPGQNVGGCERTDCALPKATRNSLT